MRSWAGSVSGLEYPTRRSPPSSDERFVDDKEIGGRSVRGRLTARGRQRQHVSSAPQSGHASDGWVPQHIEPRQSTRDVRCVLAIRTSPDYRWRESVSMRPFHESLVAIAVGMTTAFAVSACTDNTAPVVAPATAAIDADFAAPATTGVYAYVTNIGSDNVSLINTATRAVVATIPVGRAPMGVAVRPDGAFAYAVSIGDHSVSVINTATNAVEATIRVGRHPYGIAVQPDGAFAYVTAQSDATVTVFETTSNSVVDVIPVGNGPWKVAFTPNGAAAYVTNTGDNTTSVISTSSRSIIATIGVGIHPIGVAVTSGGAWVGVANCVSGSVSLIKTINNARWFDANIGGGCPYDLTFSPNGNLAYVTVPDSGLVAVFDRLDGFKRIATIPIREGPRAIAMTPGEATAYVTVGSSQRVAVVNTASNTVESIIPVNSNPFGVAFGRLPVVPRPHRPPPFGPHTGAADKAYVELCNRSALGAPSTRFRVIADIKGGSTWLTKDEYSVDLPSGGCTDVWFNPLDALSRVRIMAKPPAGYAVSCLNSQVGPGNRTFPPTNCTANDQSIVFNSLDIGHLIEFTNATK